MPNKPSKLQIPFLRQEKTRIEQLLVVEFDTCHTNTADTIRALTAAVTQWVMKNPTGRDVWHNSSEDLNIGDLLTLDSEESKELDEILKPHGIYSWEVIYEQQGAGSVSYDQVLVCDLPEEMAPFPSDPDYAKWLEDQAKDYNQRRDNKEQFSNAELLVLLDGFTQQHNPTNSDIDNKSL